MRSACFAGAIALVVFSAANAQTRPDFAGRWTSDPAPADSAARGGRAGGRGAAGTMGSGWGPNLTITQEAKQLMVAYAFFARGDMQPPLRFVYALDGSETKNSVMMGHGVQTTTARTSWQGDKLVITTIQSFPNPQDGRPTTSELTRTLSLEGPESLVVETVIAGVLGGPPTTTRTVYRKQ
jgi:arylsulfatase